MEFEPITTQEQLDSLLAAERNKFKDYVSPEELASQLAEKDGTIADLTAKNKAFEMSALKAKIARENGLRPELAERLTGDDEKALKADAKALAALVAPPEPSPLKGNEGGKNDINASISELANGLLGN